MSKWCKAATGFLLFSLMLGILMGPGGASLTLSTAQADIGKVDLVPTQPFPDTGIKPPDFTVTVKPDLEIGPLDIGDILDKIPDLSTDPPVTDPPVTDPPVTNPPVTNPPATNPPSGGNHEATDPPATNRPDDGKSSSGHFMTSEGPLFLSFRQDLTERLYMFTPMDLSLDGEYHFPLVGDTSQVVGEAKVTVQSGMTIVTYLLVNGVQVDEEEEFFTFFRDIRSPNSLKPSKLQSVKLQFGVPYSVAAWLNSDSKVLLYLNCPVSYKSSLSGLTPFSLQDPGYLSRMMALLALMD